jgi:hypothetical protein
MDVPDASHFAFSCPQTWAVLVLKLSTRPFMHAHKATSHAWSWDFRRLDGRRSIPRRISPIVKVLTYKRLSFARSQESTAVSGLDFTGSQKTFVSTK